MFKKVCSHVHNKNNKQTNFPKIKKNAETANKNHTFKFVNARIVYYNLKAIF